jgi:quinol monooxygenase YgiN
MSDRIRFARRVFLRAKPDRVDELLSTMKDRVYPGLSKENGIRRLYLLRDATNPAEFVSLTFWDSRGDADAYEGTGHYSANKDAIREYLLEDPTTSQFEVEYHTVSPVVAPPAAERKPVKRVKRAKRAKRTKRPVKRRRR